MGIFIWEIIGAFLVSSGVPAMLRVLSPVREDQERYRLLSFVLKISGGLILASAALAPFEWPFVWPGGWTTDWAYGWTFSSYAAHIRQVVVGATTVQLIIGAAVGFGLAYYCHYLASHRAGGAAGPGDGGKAERQGGDRKHWEHWIAAVIVALLLIGAFGSDLGPLVGRITRLSTPFGEAQFVQAAAMIAPQTEEVGQIESENFLAVLAKQLGPSVQKDLDHLKKIGVLDDTKDRYFMSTLLLLGKFDRLFTAAVKAWEDLKDIDLIRQRLRPLVAELRRLIRRSPANAATQLRFTADEFGKRVAHFKSRLAETEVALNCLANVAAYRNYTAKQPGRDTAKQPGRASGVCEGSDPILMEAVKGPYIADLEGLEPLLMEAVKGPYLATFMASFYGLLGDLDRAIEILENQQDAMNNMGVKFDEEFNSFYLRARLMYWDRRDADEVLEIFDEALKRVRRQNDSLKRTGKKKGPGRFDYAEAVIENSMVFVTGAELLSGPHPRRSWVIRAQIHARHLNAIVDGKIKDFPPDQLRGFRPDVLDTLGYFFLALAMTDEVKKRQENLDKAEIFLIKAAARSDDVPAPERKLFLRVVKRHQRLLQNVLQQQ